jgi:hypothetical protein
MIAILVLIMGADIARPWEILGDTRWAALMIVGMSAWVWANWLALREEEREQRTGWKPGLTEADPSGVRTLPLTPVQRRFLAVMRRYKHR